MLSQFTKEVATHITLADLAYEFPKDVYPVGRLDADSEGLLMLTNDKSLNTALLNPKQKRYKTYYVLVEGVPTPQALNQLRQGVTIKINKKQYTTQPAKAKLMGKVPNLPDRDPPVRYRKHIVDTWLSIQISEGKNRQVRKMCAKVGFPVLRLVRVQFADCTLGQGKLSKMTSGSVIKI